MIISNGIPANPNTATKSMGKPSDNKHVEGRTDSPKKSKTNQIILISTGAIALGGALFAISKLKNTHTNQAKNHQNLLVEGLKNHYNIDVKPSSLKSVIGAEEFREIIKKYSPEDFSIGNPKSSDPKEVFKNVIAGKFRISLHSHSTASDGRLNPEEFINMAAKYADKVAKTLPKSDSRPPFIVALTDHDSFEGCQEIIKIIAKNPEKYKNLKFVSGAELSVKNETTHFDLTALGVNPFDKNLNQCMDETKNARIAHMKDFVAQSNKITGKNIQFEDLEKTNYKNKETLKNKRGVVYTRNTMKLVKKLAGEEHDTAIENLFKKEFSQKGTPQMELIIENVKNAGGSLAWTHPARKFGNKSENYYQEFLQNLKNKGVSGVEANYQYTATHYQDMPNLENINNSLRDFAKKNDMFTSGGTDAHKANIFGHHHNIDEKIFKSFFE